MTGGSVGGSRIENSLTICKGWKDGRAYSSGRSQVMLCPGGLKACSIPGSTELRHLRLFSLLQTLSFVNSIDISMTKNRRSEDSYFAGNQNADTKFILLEPHWGMTYCGARLGAVCRHFPREFKTFMGNQLADCLAAWSPAPACLLLTLSVRRDVCKQRNYGLASESIGMWPVAPYKTLNSLRFLATDRRSDGC
ncbi:hypothetical protein RRG08_048467 [Elysia crispata]|uniref:Uncharacterized protein n=1 Tax=Elysia crispata TaxID=231223 RepID=A0AAE1BAZ5_9GAST|nr:hypothetical protein RRG08_048467 [Elysia crispata]